MALSSRNLEAAKGYIAVCIHLASLNIETELKIFGNKWVFKDNEKEVKETQT